MDLLEIKSIIIYRTTIRKHISLADKVELFKDNLLLLLLLVGAMVPTVVTLIVGVFRSRKGILALNLVTYFRYRTLMHSGMLLLQICTLYNMPENIIYPHIIHD